MTTARFAIAALLIVAYAATEPVPSGRAAAAQGEARRVCPTPPPCPVPEVQATRVWRVTFHTAERTGWWTVDAPDMLAAAAKVPDGATPDEVWAETYTLNEVHWLDQ